MFGFNRKKIEITPQDEVSLKPLFGIQPGTYLVAIYGLIILVLLFLLLLYPGLTKRGSRYTITTEPAGAAIRVDNVYQGTSPCTIFVSEGNRTITAVLPGFTPEEATVTSGNRIFASLIFPLHRELYLELKAPDPLEPLIEGAKSFAAWSFAGEPSATYQIPLVLSEALYRGAYQNVKTGKQDELKGILAASARFAGTTVALRDLSRALFLATSAGLAPSVGTTLQALQDAVAYIGSNPEAAQWLSSALPSASAQVVTGSDWYKTSAAVSQNRLNSLKQQSARLGERISIGPVQFRELITDQVTFYIAESEVSQKAWDSFVAEHPEWAKAQRNRLVSEGLVGPDYLELPEDPSYPAGAVPGISYHAAVAFCRWLDTKVPPNLRRINGQSLTVRLPTEEEWYVAASLFGNSVFESISGGLWEWCADPYVPFPYLEAPETYRDWIGSPEFVVKGGSWANRAQSIQPETRASLPPDSSSAFVGFRPVLATEGAHE